MTATPPVEPGALVVQTQPYLVPTPPVAGFVDLLPTSTTALAAGDYYFGVIEPLADAGEDDALDVGLATSLHVPGRTWIKWPSNPFGPGWRNLEFFGPQFEKPLMVRVAVRIAANSARRLSAGRAWTGWTTSTDSKPRRDSATASCRSFHAT